MNAIIDAVIECRFESTSARGDEEVLMKMLEVMESALRAAPGPLVCDENVCRMVQVRPRALSPPPPALLLLTRPASPPGLRAALAPAQHHRPAAPHR